MPRLKELRDAFRYRRNKGVFAFFLKKAFRRKKYDDIGYSIYPLLLFLANLKERDLVLDIGCGDFRLLDLKKRWFNLVGLDKARIMIKKARKRGAFLLKQSNLHTTQSLLETLEKVKSKALLVCGDAEKLPFEDNSFDVVVSKDLLEYVPDKQKAVEEMARVIKAGKTVAIMITPLVDAHQLSQAARIFKRLGFEVIHKKFPSAGFPYVCATKPV